MSTYLVEDEDGPIGVVDATHITDKGCEFAFQLAAHCDDLEEMHRIAGRFLLQAGVEDFGFIAINALMTMAEHILNPVLEAAEATGVEMRSGLQDMAAGIDPITGLAL